MDLMAEMMTVFKPGERIATMTKRGRVRVFEVQDDGTLSQDLQTTPEVDDTGRAGGQLRS